MASIGASEDLLGLEAWLATWRQLGATDRPALQSLHVELLARYAEPHRHYHTPQHLADCFEKLGEIVSLAEHPDEVRVGLWFHDAIYDTRASDNEHRSGVWARETMLSFGLTAAAAQRVYDLVMFTRHAAEPVGADAMVLVDADLSILGAAPQRFDEYEDQVRREYDWVAEAIFRQRRAAILREFLHRPRIYGTAPFQERYEPVARANLERSLAQLGLTA
jgi:predicted metal-dependent HD superfamily phosphohydrolase